MTRRQAGKLANVTPQTISGWSHRPDFTGYLEAHIADTERDAVQCLMGLRLRATERLGDLLNDKAPAAALRAIELVLIQTKARAHIATSRGDSPEWERIIKRIGGDVE